MNLEKDELKLLLAALALADAGHPVRVHLLAGVFDRPGRLNSTVDKLRIGMFITFDPHQSVLRVLPERVWQAVNQFASTRELFTQERPLDAALAMVSRSAVRNHTNLCENTRPAPEEKAPPPVVATRGIPAVAHVFMPCPMPMPMPMTGKSHVHVTCNSESLKNIHEHEAGTAIASGGRGEDRGHEVGELGFRTTVQILSDIRKLVPGMAQEHLDHWQERIEREDATLVNACVRQGFLQRRQIRNMAGWLNAGYLKAIRKSDDERTGKTATTG